MDDILAFDWTQSINQEWRDHRALRRTRQSAYGLWEGKDPLQEHGKVLAKILQKHRQELDRLPETIAKGKVYRLKSKVTGKDDPSRRAIVQGGYIAFLSKNKDRWVVTSHYHSEITARALETGTY